MRHLILVAALLIPTLATAQDGSRGIAFVQAVEQSWGVAMGETPQAAFAAATAQCVAGGARPEDCLQTAWCNPPGWSIDIFAQHQAGNHWHEVTCGLPSRDVAQAVAATICAQDARPYLIECALVQVYDPDGKPQMPN